MGIPPCTTANLTVLFSKIYLCAYIMFTCSGTGSGSVSWHVKPYMKGLTFHLACNKVHVFRIWYLSYSESWIFNVICSVFSMNVQPLVYIRFNIVFKLCLFSTCSYEWCWIPSASTHQIHLLFCLGISVLDIPNSQDSLISLQSCCC